MTRRMIHDGGPRARTETARCARCGGPVLGKGDSGHGDSRSGIVASAVAPLLLALAAMAAPVAAQGLPPDPGEARVQAPEFSEPRLRLAWNRYYDYPELVEILQRLHRSYPERTRLASIGKSTEGRDMWLLTVHGAAEGPAGGVDERPAMWVDGNVHGNEVQAAETCLYTAWYLLENYGRVARITELLDRVTFYILPTVNPDGRAWWFQQANTASSSRSGKLPTDNDGDGLFDEDGADDLDGDGHILQMRIRDPDGRWKTSPDDPRVMIPVKPGAKGEWTRLGLEGIDNDGDGRLNEDGPGGYDMNRNWPSYWQPNYVQYGAGEYPFSHPETRCVGEFLYAHRNVAAVQSFHNSGGMILRGPGVSSFGEYPRADVRTLDEIGRKGELMLPFYRYMIIWKDLYSVYGGFATWTYEGLGILSFTNELWSSRRLDPSRDRLGQRERLEFDDLLRSGVGFVDWKPFRHPEYGEIELGGWRKSTGRVAPSFLIEEMLHRNALFTILHGEETPDLSIDEPVVRGQEGGRARIDITVRNRRLIPSVSAHARAQRIGDPDLLEFAGDGVQLLFAGEITSRFPERVAAVRHRPDRILNWRGVRFDQPYRVRFIVQGQGGFRISYRSDKGGVHEVRAAVR